ncbi:hypothetical protein AAFF_G00067450 [Aldrovandia affinis]|uniref:Uncharacterized protein n=1 Tax=Aldrovandia affinis TaxID=143900 RepID=A0AAD7WYR4_9TELE|nr:hypothetical protein AAFF_G00067450 [Aldrovandia affinis]
MERIGVDILGPFPVTDSGNKYAYAVPDQSASTTEGRLVEKILCRFGAPAEIHSDQVNYLRQLQERLRVVHDLTRQAQAESGVRQKQAYDTQCRDQVFAPGDQVWIFCPSRTKGPPKLQGTPRTDTWHSPLPKPQVSRPDPFPPETLSVHLGKAGGEPRSGGAHHHI